MKKITLLSKYSYNTKDILYETQSFWEIYIKLNGKKLILDRNNDTKMTLFEIHITYLVLKFKTLFIIILFIPCSQQLFRPYQLAVRYNIFIKKIKVQ